MTSRRAVSVGAFDGETVEFVPLVVRPSLQLPFDDPVLVFGLAMLVFLVAPLVLERSRLPGIVGIILVGAIIGPNGAGLLERGETIQLLGEVGLIYLMFVAGLEINLHQFVEYRDRSIAFGLLSFIIPQGAGTVVGVYVLDLTVPAALLFAAIFSSHTLLAYPVVTRLGIVNEESVTATVGGTILTDTLALLVLAVVIAATEGELTTRFWVELSGGLTLFFVGIWLVVPRVGRWFFRIHGEESYVEFLFVMAVLFICAFLAEVAGVEHIIGAFLAGLALNRLIPHTGQLMNRIEFGGNALFIPFFLLSVGMLVDGGAVLARSGTAVLSLPPVDVAVSMPTYDLELASLVIGGSLVVSVIVTKLIAAAATGRLYGYSRDEVLGMFGLSVGQAAAALAIVQIGFDAGVPGFDQDMVNGVVVLILVASVLSPAIVDRAGNALVRSREREAYDPGAVPRRILVPVSRESRHWKSLLDLAFTIRDERATEPLHVLSVVQPSRDVPTEALVARAEQQQEEIAAYAASAEVPVDRHTRVNHNIASGIVRTTVESRISMVVIGWDGATSRGQYVFGHTIDQVLARTAQLTLVGRVHEPLNTTERIFLVLPPGIVHNEGFDEALHTVKHLAEETSAPVRGLAVGGDPEWFEQHSALVDPKISDSYESVADWRELLSRLRSDARRSDLILCLSARRNTPGWDDELQTLPKRISTLTDGNFVIVYPAQDGRDDDRQFFRFS